jgi:hypothetical protein
MTSLDWSALTASLAGGAGLGFIAMTAVRRRRRRRRAEYAQAASGSRRRRIDVVAIDDGAERARERERNA